MRETFKNVSVFFVFLAALLLWSQAQAYLNPYFDFDYGRTVLTLLWSVFVVILFHLLYYFLGKSSEKTIYLSTVFTLIVVGGLVYYQKLPLQ